MSRHSFDDPHGESIEARQELLDNRNEHAPKRHRTQKRAKALTKKKKSAAAHKVAVNDTKRRKKLAAVRAYWKGARAGHP